jgi:hypothetical protein
MELSAFCLFLIHIIHTLFLLGAAIVITSPPGAKRKPSYATAPAGNITS